MSIAGQSTSRGRLERLVMTRSRRILRAALLLVLVSALSAVGMAFLRRYPPTERAPVIAPVDGWAAKGVHYTHDGARGGRWHVSADAVASAPVRFGVFSVGFMQRLEANGVDVLIELGVARDLRDLGVDLFAALNAITGPGSRGKHFTSGRIRGISVRVEAPDFEAFELRAARCDVGAFTKGRVVFRDAVVVRTGGAQLTFSTLAYDIAAKRFVGEDAPSGEGAIAAYASERQRIDIVNAAFQHLVPSPAENPSLLQD